ncbi:hypothetical protein A8B75_02865 [Sphingomonadales bacterium EhC05]|nr:hypothetical protein A8B75_02865 [Sphingomonadales bacterium EhC05]
MPTRLITLLDVFAAIAKTIAGSPAALDCRVASLLAMTEGWSIKLLRSVLDKNPVMASAAWQSSASLATANGGIE